MLFLTSCAIQIGPQGGPKDIFSPKIVKEEPPNKTVNFSKEKITLYTNEYPKLNNPGQEIIISPMINPMPKIVTRKKTISIKFEQKLKDSTTYAIQFGKSIVDITESNVLSDYIYLFSTGPKLDSLELKGKSIDILTNASKENIKVMLYLTGNDSCIYKTKPEYYAKTSKEGGYVFKNLHSNKFRIYALDDENGNYLFDKGEKIAFSNELIDLNTNMQYKDLKLFKENEEKLRIIDNGQKEKNKFYLAFNAPVDSMKIFSIIDGQQNALTNYIKFIEKRDSAFFWYTPKSDSIKLIVNLWGENYSKDTVSFIINTEKKDIKQKQPSKLTIKPTINFYTTGNMYIEFNEPIKTIDKSKITFYKDTNKVASLPDMFFADSSYTKSIINFTYEAGKNYKLIFDKGSFTALNNTLNDSIVIPIKTLKETELGLITVNVVIERTKIPIIAQLLDNGFNVIRESSLQKSSKITYNGLLPGKYYIRCILDKNGNSNWDTGNLLKDRQPEEIIYFKDEINLKANWELNDLMIKIH